MGRRRGEIKREEQGRRRREVAAAVWAWEKDEEAGRGYLESSELSRDGEAAAAAATEVEVEERR